ncbi:hypothetical protein [Novosphingobium sp. NBM11]|uniref:hypothetical protein n=1 Tax=Novosphingobium sp. NBM11 TaxID=2596914 RepID=UPI0018924E2B|nr:hypothetical protein [Novosphingobium sp. NBM11]
MTESASSLNACNGDEIRTQHDIALRRVLTVCLAFNFAIGPCELARRARTELNLTL